MAVITISAAGGNWNSTATWVGGSIPTTTDSIKGDSGSGPLTVNVNATVQYADFINSYSQTLTINAGINLQFSLASATTTFGSGMSFAGTGTITFQSVASTIVQNTTNRIPNVQFTGNVTRTLSTNLYITNLSYSNGPTFNGNTIYVGGNLLLTGGGLGQDERFAGTSNIILDGTGITNAGFSNSITITGNYNTYGGGVALFNGATLTYITGTTPSHFNVILYKRATSSDSITLNCNQPIKLFLYNWVINSTSATWRNFTINLTGPFTPNLIGCYTVSRAQTTDNNTPIYIFAGNSVSATTLNLVPVFRTTSVSTNPPSGDFYDYEGPELQLPTGYTHYIGSMQLNGGTTSNPFIKSSTSGVKATLNLGSKITSQIINYNFTDINASGGQQIIAINGTISNCDNITNVYPSGSGGGGSFTFVN